MQKLEEHQESITAEMIHRIDRSCFHPAPRRLAWQECEEWRQSVSAVSGRDLTDAAAGLVHAMSEYGLRHPGKTSTAEAVTLTLLSTAFYDGNIDLCRWSLRERGHFDSTLSRSDLDRLFSSVPQAELRECAQYLCRIMEAGSH